MALALTAGSAILGASNTRKQGKLAMQTARRNAQVLKNQDAQDADATLEGMARRRIENSRTLGAIRARLGGGGIRQDLGSTADYLEEATSRLELNILDEARSQEYRSQARGNQADAEIHRGNVARHNANQAATAQLIQGGARVASQASAIAGASKPGQFANNAFGGGSFGKWF